MIINDVASALLKKHDISLKESKRRKNELDKLNKSFNDYFYGGDFFGRIIYVSANSDGMMSEPTAFNHLDKTKFEVRICFSAGDSQVSYSEFFLMYVINGVYVISDLESNLLCDASCFHNKLHERMMAQI